MSDHIVKSINAVLAGVRPARRDFLRSVLLKAAAVGGALCLPASEVLAQGGGGGGKGGDGGGKGGGGGGKGGGGGGKGGDGGGKGGGGGGKGGGGGGNAAAGVAGAGCAKGKGDDT